jgi:hypothetical protein
MEYVLIGYVEMTTRYTFFETNYVICLPSLKSEFPVPTPLTQMLLISPRRERGISEKGPPKVVKSSYKNKAQGI